MSPNMVVYRVNQEPRTVVAHASQNLDDLGQVPDMENRFGKFYVPKVSWTG